MLKYFIMKQRYSLRSNAVKFRAMALVMMALVMGGKMAVGQDPWTPPADGGTFRLRSTGTGTTNFNVYNAAGTDIITDGTNKTKIYGLVNLSGQLNLIFDNDTTILYDAHFFLNTDNASVTLKLGNGNAHTPTNPTMKIVGVTGYNSIYDNRQPVAFFLRPSISTDATNHKVIIEGNDDSNSSLTNPEGLSFANNFVIDGDGPVLVVEDGNTMEPKVTTANNSTGNLKTYGLFRLQQGTLHLKNVTVQNFCTKYGNAGAIQVFTNNTTAAVDLEFDHCLFTSIGSTNSPVLRMQGAGGTNENRDARIKNCKFVDIFGAKSLDQLNVFGNVFGGDSTSVFTDNANATVRTLGNNKVPLTLDNCHFIRNYGCPVRWHGCGSAKDMVVNNCLVEDSFTKKDGGQVYGGGGLLLKGPATITYCTIRNNRTDGSGGGIYLSTYVDFNDGTPELVPEHSILRLDPNTKIYNNIAMENGGGVAIEAQLMRNPYNESLSSYDYIIYFTPSGQPFKTQFIQNGGEIYNNTALGNYGGGVYITRSEQTPFYEVICSLDYGKIYNNKTGTDGTTGNGGGVAIKTYRNEQCSFYNDENPPADIAAQDVIVEMSYPDANPASTEEGEMMRIDNNKANNGGGVYVEAYPNTLPNNNVPNKVDVNVYGLAKVTKNNANNNGGGLYVEYGTVRINSGTFGGTTEIGGTTESLGNIAKNDGGGIYLNNGDIFTDVLPHAETGGGGGGTGPGGGGGGGGYVSPLPEGYTELDYIESISHDQYINTGLNLNYEYTLWIDALLPNFTPNNNKGATLIWAGSTNDHRIGCAFFNSGKLVRSWGNNQADVWTYANLTSSGISIANRFQVMQTRARISITQGTNSRISTYTGTSSGTSSYNILIGKSERSGINSNAKGALRIFRVKIWNTLTTDPESTDNLLRNLYPCKRISDGAIGLFDLQNNVFYGNAGTGSFTAGPVVSGGRSVAPSGSESLGLPPFAHNNNGKVGGTRAATAGCTISYNTATRDGGGCYVNHGSIFLMNAKVNNNKAANGKGGGIFTENGSVYVNYWDPQDPKNGLNYSVRNEQNPSQINNNSAELNGGGIITRFGKVLMRGQTHEANKHIQVSGNTTTQGSGGGIFCLGGSSASTTDEYVRLINVKIQGNQATSGTGIDSVMMGDGITKVGVSNGCGGGVYLQHGVINMTRCELRSNSAHVNGGGINDHSGNINIKGCIIDGNTAGAGWGGNNPSSLCSGGGIFTVRGDVDIKNHPIGTNLYYRTEIKNNTARNNGGGITTRQGKVTATGEYGSINIGGTEIKKSILIEGNTATQGSGGGVFCLGDVSTTPTVYIDFHHVDLIGNKAKDGSQTTEVTLEDGTTVMTVSNGCGGGVYLQRGVIEIENNIIQKNEANMDGGGIYNQGGEIDVDGCLIGGEEADGNTARRSGGGIYTDEGDIDIEDIVLQTDNTLVRLESKVRYNTAKENGGGINTHKGTITVNGKQLDDQIEISHNTANKGGGIYANEGIIIAYNAKINNNTATENGGGINNHAGNIDLYGGTLSNNTATKGNGGGAYTHIGDINIEAFNPGNIGWLSLSDNNGTKIYNNLANMNGGGINNHTGLVDLHYATLQNNTATLGNGGGIYCMGPHASGTGFTIRLLRSTLNQNKTRGQDGTEAAPTGRGGGIYLHYGRIFAQGSNLTRNKANINGGAINNHEGNIRAYGCQISNNEAVTGKGGGIYANQGLIVVGPSGVAGPSVIEWNSAGKNGGGINNHEGDIEINGDYILNNSAEEDGGGIYLALGNITMNGGKIDNNSAGKRGGGVYMGGTKPGNEGFLIQERIPKPVVEIIDVKDVGSDYAVVHYHIVDDGNGGSFNENITSGVIKGDNASFANLGVAHAIGDVPGCRRDTIKSLIGGQNYEVKAWVKNANVNPYTADTSSVVSFTTYSNQPVVHTGSAGNVTATSADASGKLIYKGNGNVLENAIGIQYSTNKNMSNASIKYVSNATENVPVFPEGSYYTVSLDFGQPADNYATRKFYLRAIATNSANPAQTGYGELDSITLPKNTPNMGTNLVKYEFVTINAGQPDEKPGIKFSFEMPNSVLGDNYSNYGFVLSTDDDPELNKDHTINKNNVEIDPNNSKKFSATVPLSVFYNSQNYPSFNYYVRAFATAALNEPDAMDVTNYSVTAATKFVIPTPDGDPVVRLVSISNIAQDSAVVKAIVVIRGNEPITKYGLCWSDDASVQPTATGGSHITVRQANAEPNYYQNPAPGNVRDSTYFTVIMSPLVLNTTYYLRVFATNVASPSANDYVYGNDFNFTTLPAEPPTVRLVVDNITHTAATINCTVDNGGNNVTEYGIYWGLAAEGSPVYKTTFTGDNLDQNAFSVNLPASENTTVYSGSGEIPSALGTDTEYKVYAYGINAVGTYTGREVKFRTTYNRPILSNVEIVHITYDAVNNTTSGVNHDLDHTITVKGKITSNGDHTPTEYGFVYSANTSEPPTLDNLPTEWDCGYVVASSSPTQGTDYTAVLSANVNANKEYLIRPYAKVTNSSGTVEVEYGNAVTALTLPQVNRGDNPSNITLDGMTLHGLINTNDPEGHLKQCGFCWVAANPSNPTPPATLTIQSALAANQTNPGSGGSVPDLNGVLNIPTYSGSYPFNMDISGFNPGTKYYWRAWVRNELDSISYSTISADYVATWTYGILSEVMPSGAGSVTPVATTGENLPTPVPSGGNVYCDAGNFPVTLTANAHTGYVFNHCWDKTYIDEGGNEITVNIFSTDNHLEINNPESATFTAYFNPIVSWTVNGNGLVTGVDGNNNTVESGSNYPVGTTIILTATPNGSNSFVNWTDEHGNEWEMNPLSIVLDGPVSLTANFSDGRGNASTSSVTVPRPRDIYPAPAREPWDWDDDFFFPTDTLRNGSKEVVNPVNIPQIDNNSAEYGGGIYVAKNTDNPAKIVFAGGNTEETAGTINNNTASEAGGGVYINESASMQMKGHCHVNSNHVPAGKKGGGIYLDGILKVGDQPGDEVSAHALQVNLNWAGSEYQETNRNNVYLPNDPDPLPTADENLDAGNKQRVITLLSDISGTYTIVIDPEEITEYYSKIGLSVDHGYRAVIYTKLNDESNEPLEPAREPWLTQLITSGSLNGAIFDDANKYYALHISNPDNPDNLKPQYDYLYGCWTTEVTSDPGENHIKLENGVYHIKTNRGLAWFTSIVNGLNGQTADSSAKAVLEADVDMSEHLWVPIGSVKHFTGGTGTSIVFDDSEGAYTGEFNGQGNLITGLKCYFVTGIKRYGLFGTVTSDNNNHIGKVWNTFVDDYRFYSFRMGEEAEYKYAYRMGGIASELTGSATISACEARGVMNTPAEECEVANTYKGGLVGKMDGTAVIHSSMAMPTMQGQADYVGGLVGQLGASNKLLNSFANPKFPDASYTMNTGKYLGGLVGENNGLVENCYSRLQGNEPTSDGTNSVFGWLAGTNNTDNIKYCYAPTGKSTYKKAGDGNISGHGNYSATQRYSKKYGFKHRDHQMTVAEGTTNPYIIAKTNDTLIGGLMHALNHWVDTANKVTTTYAKWTRTMASHINDDYPVPMLIYKNDDETFNCVGSKDTIYLLYEDNINDMWAASGKNFRANDTLDSKAAMYLYDVQPEISSTSIPPIYDTVKITGNNYVRLYINEDIGIAQPAGSLLKARVGVTIKNDRKGSNDQTDNPNWHLFSSAINEVPIGLDYHTTEEGYEGVSDYYVLNNFRSMMQSPPKVGNGEGIQNTYYWNRSYMDPPKTTWSKTNVGYFPTNTPYGTWRNTSDNGFFDLYTYSEEFYHWVNFKREGKPGFYDHWHMDASNDSTHEVLPYQNELTMPKGKGYMMALSSESMMMADGELNTGDVYTYVTVTPLGTNNPKPQHRYDEPWRMLNMIGNPYQSYLDFEKFVNDTRDDPNSNSDLLYCNSYATRDDKEGEFIFYTMEQSRNNRELMASQYIHPHQGFFVKAKIPGYLKFTDAMRVAGTNTSLGSNFRDINYPLVNLICYEPSGHRDFTTVEVNRPELGGGSKMQNLRTGNASIYAHFEDNDYQTLFTPMGVSTVPVWFETEEDGVFTLRWNTLHGDFNYLHLIDHIMGTDIDCLTTDEYIFEAKTSDYESRFKLVFDCVGVEEYEEDDLNSATFAFQMGDELVINGEGMLQMFDISGRCLMSTQTMGQQSSVSLPKTAAGLYLLRLTTDSQVKVQKMVIK